MSEIRTTAKKIPYLKTLYRAFRDYQLRLKGTEKVFTEIYQKKQWRGGQSVSGIGSDLTRTLVVRTMLSDLLRELKIRMILDVPCGDFNWMKEVNLEGVHYVGADIVRDLIALNNEKFNRDGIKFMCLDVITDQLPKADLILSRDCLVHFSYSDIYKAIENICNSKSKYLLTTTFTDRENNQDIPTGRWRPLNLQAPPFSFPQPIRIISEKCTEADGRFSDKSLALWKIADIEQTFLGRH